ncbi:MAG TPA: STAS domain-containing protein [Vicinamibacterales bacterium]|nr:STAS domain-containing protein [Vicinamibacterales bacterium]
MTVTERKVGDVVIVDVNGKMLATENPGRLKDKITSLLFQGEKQIVLNLANVGYVDSSGLGEMVACYGSAMREGAKLKLANAGNRITDLLVMTRLVTIFDAHDTEDAAIKSFAP